MAIIGDYGMMRLAAFGGIFLLMMILQAIWPRRPLAFFSPYGLARLLTNISLAALNSIMLKMLSAATIPLAAVSAAYYARQQGWGLMNNIELGAGLEMASSLIILDLAIYGQHVLAHFWPFLWRFHQVHHADTSFDLTTALRFHPVEIAISMAWKIALVFMLGPSPLTVVLFEIILNGCAMFNHSNLYIPGGLDRVIRLLLVTPDMHRIHHSTIRSEQDSNFGFNISLWDRLFGSYLASPLDGHEKMKIGLSCQQDKRPLSLLWNLARPFSGASPRQN